MVGGTLLLRSTGKDIRLKGGSGRGCGKEENVLLLLDKVGENRGGLAENFDK